MMQDDFFKDEELEEAWKAHNSSKAIGPDLFDTKGMEPHEVTRFCA